MKTLEEFKALCHQILDELEVPKFEDQDCRIAKRLRWQGATLATANEKLDAVTKLVETWRKTAYLFEFGWEGYGSAAEELEQALNLHDRKEATDDPQS